MIRVEKIGKELERFTINCNSCESTLSFNSIDEKYWCCGAEYHIIICPNCGHKVKTKKFIGDVIDSGWEFYYDKL